MHLDLRKYTLYAGTALTIASLVSCHGHEEGHEHGSHEADEGREEKEEITTPGGGALIHLDSVRANRLGVSARMIEPGNFHETLPVGARLEATPGQQSTVTARSAGLVRLSPGVAPGVELRAGQTVATISGKSMAGGDSNEAASVALRAAKRELDRLTPLHADGIVSTRDYNAALQAYESAKAAAGSNTAATGSGSAALAPASGIVTAVLVSEGQYAVSYTHLTLPTNSRV